VAMTDLNTLISPESPYYLALASAINNAGEIVGLAVDQRTGDTHAFLATPAGDGANPLPALQRSSSRWHISEKARLLLRQKGFIGAR
jgi:probable HAF family extracellular repeat protein